MKKIFSLTSVALLAVMAITGCSCSAKGEYKFDHIEYQAGGETLTTDCSVIDGLPILVQGACVATNALGSDYIHFRMDDTKFYSGPNDTIGLFYKIEDDKILLSNTEDGNYTDSGYRYKMGKIYSGENIVKVYKK